MRVGPPRLSSDDWRPTRMVAPRRYRRSRGPRCDKLYTTAAPACGHPPNPPRARNPRSQRPKRRGPQQDGAQTFASETSHHYSSGHDAPARRSGIDLRQAPARIAREAGPLEGTATDRDDARWPPYPGAHHGRRRQRCSARTATPPWRWPGTLRPWTRPICGGQRTFVAGGIKGENGITWDISFLLLCR